MDFNSAQRPRNELSSDSKKASRLATFKNMPKHFSSVNSMAYAQTSLPKVIWEEGRVAALSHTYAVKSPLVTMARPKFAPKSIPSRGPIHKPHYLPHLWTRPTYDAKRHPDPLRRFSTTHWTDRPTHRPTDRPRESLITIGRCATRATQQQHFTMFSLCFVRFASCYPTLYSVAQNVGCFRRGICLFVDGFVCLFVCLSTR